MTQWRSIVAKICCAILLWMSAVAGYFPAVPTAERDKSAFAAVSHGSHHHIQAHSGPRGGHQGIVESPDNQTAACIATCIELISDKILPKVAANSWKADQSYVPVQYAPTDDALRTHSLDLLVYWPTGPPDHGWLAGSGAERLVALNARIRI